MVILKYFMFFKLGYLIKLILRYEIKIKILFSYWRSIEVGNGGYILVV